MATLMVFTSFVPKRGDHVRLFFNVGEWTDPEISYAELIKQQIVLRHIYNHLKERSDKILELGVYKDYGVDSVVFLHIKEVHTGKATRYDLEEYEAPEMVAFLLEAVNGTSNEPDQTLHHSQVGENGG